MEENFSYKQKEEIRKMINEAADRKIEEAIKTHAHDGVLTQLVDLGDLSGLFEVVSAVPVKVPRTVYDQIKIYINGATLRLYVYDSTGLTWRYAALT